MARILCVILIVLLGVQYANADTANSVELQMVEGDALYMYECYPLNSPVTQYHAVIVYVTTAEGFQGYYCDYDGGAWVLPFVQPEAERAMRIK